ncbi:hypothetical protein L2E82_32649 [Cichorium intybus]|uniref:Uncharacterized protein n=1 Tax=Cichorium intybus TaxID=13427 RepID=A0ACB9BHS0_CICIN|nr:hypothetical protein L2E82_32649 [Cichorium intybus]
MDFTGKLLSESEDCIQQCSSSLSCTHRTLPQIECTSLEELYLSYNGIAKMEGLSTLANLRVLDVYSNKLSTIEDIEKLTWKNLGDKDLRFLTNETGYLRFADMADICVKALHDSTTSNKSFDVCYEYVVEHVAERGKELYELSSLAYPPVEILMPTPRFSLLRCPWMV